MAKTGGANLERRVIRNRSEAIVIEVAERHQISTGHRHIVLIRKLGVNRAGIAEIGEVARIDQVARLQCSPTHNHAPGDRIGHSQLASDTESQSTAVQVKIAVGSEAGPTATEVASQQTRNERPVVNGGGTTVGIGAAQRERPRARLGQRSRTTEGAARRRALIVRAHNQRHGGAADIGQAEIDIPRQAAQIGRGDVREDHRARHLIAEGATAEAIAIGNKQMAIIHNRGAAVSIGATEHHGPLAGLVNPAGPADGAVERHCARPVADRREGSRQGQIIGNHKTPTAILDKRRGEASECDAVARDELRCRRRISQIDLLRDQPGQIVVGGVATGSGAAKVQDQIGRTRGRDRVVLPLIGVAKITGRINPRETVRARIVEHQAIAAVGERQGPSAIVSVRKAAEIQTQAIRDDRAGGRRDREAVVATPVKAGQLTANISGRQRGDVDDKRIATGRWIEQLTVHGQ